ncbi:MAG: NAD-dependent epimerase/dehydratase family protein [Chloroflexi bacterium]|nr:NAD-dependent epimerase/dehydratase family protein [Chloroflexota bacterium]
MRAFVTGAGGYMGQSLVKVLQEKGYEVRGLARNPARLHNLADAGVEAVLGDIRRLESIEGFFDGTDVVFHLAGTMVGHERELYLTNIVGTKNVLEAATSAGVKRFVLGSSATVYGGHGGEFIDENSQCHPVMPYGRSKLESEQVVLEKSGEGLIGGSVCRIGGVYGPRSQMLMLENAGRTHVRLVGKGDNWMSVVHVEDVASALLAAAERGHPGGIYNIVDDEPVRLKDFYNYLAYRLGAPDAKHISEANAKRLARIVGFFGRVTGKAVVFNADFVKMILASLKLSNEKMRTELGIQLKHPNYRVGLDSILNELGAKAAT